MHRDAFLRAPERIRCLVAKESPDYRSRLSGIVRVETPGGRGRMEIRLARRRAGQRLNPARRDSREGYFEIPRYFAFLPLNPASRRVACLSRHRRRRSRRSARSVPASSLAPHWHKKRLRETCVSPVARDGGQVAAVPGRNGGASPRRLPSASENGTGPD